jgi:RNA polymerase sigma-70 factor (ECF subfamily)
LPSGQVSSLVEHLFRKRAGQMVAHLTRLFGPAHLDLAEEVVQEALVKALQQWPFHGVPANPGGWLLSVARNAALDALRRNTAFRQRQDQIVAELERTGRAVPADAAGIDRLFEDDELQMMLLCCDPALSRDASVALALKTVGGFSVAEIARAFLAEPSTIAQRLVRAKKQLRHSPLSHEQSTIHTDRVLEVLYLMFNEGYTAAGESLVREDVCAEALRLARLVAGNPASASPQADALAALLAFQAARLPARVDEAGDVVVLADQDRARWDRALLAVGFAHFERAARGDEITPYHLQAAIAAVHARGAITGEATAWREILSFYDQLMICAPSPVVALNRAVAVARVEGAMAGLAALAAIDDRDELDGYYLLPAVEGQLLCELGDAARAADAFRAALACPCSAPERRLLERKLRGTATVFPNT